MSSLAEIPDRDQVIQTLDKFLRERGSAYGLTALGIFGSLARDEARRDSDVDVVYKADPSARLTLYDLVFLRDELTGLLGRPVDLIQYRDGMPARLRARVEREAVYV